MHAEHNDTIKTSDTILRKIYLPIYWKVVCERELETEPNCNILAPTLLAINAFLSRSLGLLNRGPGGPALSVTYSHSSIFSPTRLISKLLNRGPEGSLCWLLAFSTASCLQLVWSPNWLIGGLRAPSAGCWLSLPYLEFPVHYYIIVQRPPSSCGRHKLHSFNPSTVKATLSYSSTGCTSYLHRCISYFDSLAGS